MVSLSCPFCSAAVDHNTLRRLTLTTYGQDTDLQKKLVDFLCGSLAGGTLASLLPLGLSCV